MSTRESSSLTIAHNPVAAQALTPVPGRHHFGLNRRQYEFAKHYSRLGVAKEAYRLAGYEEDVDGANSSRLAKNPKVRAAVSAFDQKRDAELEMSAQAVRAQAAAMVRLDLADFVDEHGDPLPLHRVPAHVRRALQRLKVTKRVSRRGKGEDEVVEESVDYEYVAPDKARTLALLADMTGAHRGGQTDVAGAVGRGIAALLRAMWASGNVAPGAASRAPVPPAVQPGAAAEPPIDAEFSRI